VIGFAYDYTARFFKSIAGLFAVAAVDPSSLIAPSLNPVAGRAIQDQLQLLTYFMHSHLERELVGMTFPEVAPEQKLSGNFPYQFGIDLALEPWHINTLADAQIIERFISPATKRLASEIINRKATRFALLPLPKIGDVDGACRVFERGISIRGLRAYDIGARTGFPHWAHRFDALFG